MRPIQVAAQQSGVSSRADDLVVGNVQEARALEGTEDGGPVSTEAAFVAYPRLTGWYFLIILPIDVNK